jgi:hypothetical protein
MNLNELKRYMDLTESSDANESTNEFTKKLQARVKVTYYAVYKNTWHVGSFLEKRQAELYTQFIQKAKMLKSGLPSLWTSSLHDPSDLERVAKRDNITNYFVSGDDLRINVETTSLSELEMEYFENMGIKIERA